MIGKNQESINRTLLKFFKPPTQWISHITETPIKLYSKWPVLWMCSARLIGTVPDGFSENIFNWGGSGADSNRHVARAKAITEAVERWAAITYGLRESTKAGFELDETTTGVAAFPGKAKLARQFALKEAIERFIFSQVAQSAFKIVRTRVRLWHILTRTNALLIEFQRLYRGEDISFYYVPNSYGTQAMLCKWSLPSGGIVIGYASEKTDVAAIRKSLVEAYRHRVAAEKLRSIVMPIHRIELTLKHWAEEAKQTTIQDWFERRELSSNEVVIPKNLLVDEELLGPWNPEVSIWRCLFPGTLNIKKSEKSLLYY